VAQETVSFRERRLSKNNFLPRATFSSVIGLSSGLGMVEMLVVTEVCFEQEIKNANPILNKTKKNELLANFIVNEQHSNFQSKVSYD
jgi:hypothetical protein